MLKSLAGMLSLPWVYMGDFNDMLSVQDKQGRRSYLGHLLNGFRETITKCQLINLPLKGYQFTWKQGRGTDRWVKE